MHHRTSDAILTLRTGKGKLRPAIAYLRNEAIFPDQCEAAALLCSQKAQHIELVAGRFAADSWEDVWHRVAAGKISKPQKAINWMVAVLLSQAEILSRHCALRDSILCHFFNGKYVAAAEELVAHIKTFGHTLWSAKWNLVVAEEIGGAENRKALQERYNSQSGASGVAYFTDIFGRSADKVITEERFRALVKASLPADRFEAFIELLFLEDLPAKYDICSLFDLIENLPVIDRYELLIKFLTIHIATEGQDKHLNRAILKLDEAINDEALRYFSDCLQLLDEDKTPTARRFGTVSLFPAWDAYLISDYNTAIDFASKTIQARPWLFGAHELLVKANMYIGLRSGKREDTISRDIQYHLYNIFAKNSDAEESLTSLLRLASRLGIFALTAALKFLHVQHATPLNKNKWSRISALFCCLHGPRNFEFGFPQHVNAAYLNSCKFGNEGITTEFFASLASGVPVDSINCPEIPAIRREFFGGVFAAKHGRYVEAEARLNAFEALQNNLDDNPLSPFGIEEARRTLIEVARLKGDVEHLEKLVVAAYIERPQSVRRLPITAAYEACQERRREASVHIEYPILGFLALSDPHQVSLCLKRFLRKAGIKLPSQIIDRVEFAPHLMGVLFIKVCSPEVLDSLEDLDSTQKVDFERIRLLEWVKNSVPYYANLAKTEILAVTQNAELRGALDTLNEAKVVLDIAALRNAEHERFQSAYMRYQAQRDLGIAQQADAIVKTLLQLQETGGASKLVRLNQTQEHEEALFADAFKEVRSAFLSSPYYGLEACLSGQIRHGIITQHIRNPFVERKLAVKATGIERKNAETYWAQLLGTECRPHEINAAVEALVQLTQRVDEWALQMKENWIQSRTEDAKTSGLFDYSVSGGDISHMYRLVDYQTTSLDTFLDYVFDFLLKRTRISLQAVRSFINKELQKKLTEIVDTAILRISELDHSTSLQPLRHALTSARQDVEDCCLQMVRWFQESKTSLMGDSDFELIARTAVGMIERLNPDYRGRFDVKIDSEFRIRGRHFRGVVLMIFFLLDNAVQHSRVAPQNFSSSLTIVAKANRLSICVSALMSSPEDAEQAKQTISLKIDQHHREFIPERVIREGGSGLAKVIATVRYEFSQDNPRIEANCNGSSLAVTVITRMEGIAV